MQDSCEHHALADARWNREAHRFLERQKGPLCKAWYMIDDTSHETLAFRGWFCACGIFNGEEKDVRLRCRSCDQERETMKQSAWRQQLYEGVAQRVKHLRHTRGLTAREVAQRLGCTQAVVNRVEEGASVSLAFLVGFAQLVDVKIDELLPPPGYPINKIFEKED